MNIELGSFWLIKDSGCIATVKSIIAKANGGATVVYTITDNSGISSYRMSCEYERFTKMADKFLLESELKDSLNKEYVKGKTEGYNEGYQHGFTLAKEKIAELDEEDSKRIYNDGYKDGHNDCSEELHSYMSEKELVTNNEGYEEGFDDGYNSAIKEMKSDKLNSGVCGSNVPNKETQDAMQEVLNKDSNEFSGIWAAKDNSGKIKVLSINEGTCDIELVEYIGESYLCVGDTATISIDYLKEHWIKERAEYEYTINKDEQLEKELALVEKYPHYYKDIRHLNIIDIYRFFDLFEVTDPCIQHSTKKLAVGGKRGAKDYEKDIKEAMDTLKRWEYMQEENKRGGGLDD